MDVNFFDFAAVKFVAVECGAAGVCVMLKLLTEIFRNGFWLQWGEDEQAMMAWELHGMVGKETVGTVVAECLKRGFFDAELYNLYGILTSEEIQRKYAQGTRGRREVDIEGAYWLPDLPRNAKVTRPQSVGTETASPEPTPEPAPADATEVAEAPEVPAVSKPKSRDRRVFVPPTEAEVVEYFVANGYRADVARRAWRYYDVAKWRDSGGNPVKSWKQKMLAVWMKPENAMDDKHAEHEGCIDF